MTTVVEREKRGRKSKAKHHQMPLRPFSHASPHFLSLPSSLSLIYTISLTRRTARVPRNRAGRLKACQWSLGAGERSGYEAASGRLRLLLLHRPRERTWRPRQHIKGQIARTSDGTQYRNHKQEGVNRKFRRAQVRSKRRRRRRN